MPLNRPGLALSAGASGVADARRWVASTFRDIEREDLVECGELAVSELVTNALLHGAGPISVRVRGTREHPRVEVRDGSVEPPELPTEGGGVELDGVLLTFGRGLTIVARASDAWGAEIEDDGKVVWFTPVAEFSDGEGAPGRITGVVPAGEATGEHPTDLLRIELIGVPVRDYVTFQLHFRELRREVRLLSLAHESDYPLAKDLSGTFDRLGRFLLDAIDRDEVVAAEALGRDTIDVDTVMSARVARSMHRFVELLDLTDAFCREEKMLSLARSPEQRAFQAWFLGELVRQASGESARPWVGTGAVSAPVPRTSVS
ncbi:MAG: ATP-binding protein [Nocardioides sp.]|nr:ATP-binding protein [Nocardioides sp.]